MKNVFVSRVKELIALAHIDGDYAGHSFRAGAACDLYASNVPIEAIMRMGRWKSQAALETHWLEWGESEVFIVVIYFY